MLVLVLLVFLVSFVKSYGFVCGFFWMFGAMQTVQFCCLAYFGTSLNPFTISLLFEELEDVFSETVHMTGYLWYVPLCVIIPYYACARLIKAAPHRFTFAYAWGVVVCFFIAFAVQSHIKPDLLMRSYCYAGFNTITAYTAYFGNILPKQVMQRGTAEKEVVFKPYIVSKIAQTPDVNVIVIMGESLNRNHFSLYGYKRDTTPLLKKRAQQTNFIYKNALSGAVNTLIAVPNFLHVQREPENYKKQLKSDTYLPKLAKENGFKTVYIGLQGKAVYTKEALSFFDKSFVYKLSSEKCAEDECIQEALSETGFDTPLFLFIQKRNPHAPYEQYYPAKYAVFDKKSDTVNETRVNTYDNALLYEDFVIDNLLSFFEKNAKRPTYVYYISDHGEAMGENGQYGHSFLAPAVTDIPFIFMMFGSQDKVYGQKIKDMFYPTAYEIGVLIAEKLGYSIENPNIADGIFYTNGHNKMGKAGYIVIEKNAAKKTLKRTVVQGNEKE